MLDFIVNPIAGGNDGKKIKKAMPLIERFLSDRNIPYAIHYTDHAGHAKELTSSLITSGATDIVAVGGDGTLHEVINGFSCFDKVALGIIPLGTGNDFAAALKIPTDPVKAIELIADGAPKFTDYMQMPTVRGINIIGMGMDVEVLRRYAALKKKTKFGYTRCLIKTLFNFDYVEFKADTDMSNGEYRSFIACVANGYRYGGGIPICPPADATDKRLDFVAIKEMKKIKLPAIFLKLKAGKINTCKEYYHEKVSDIDITVDGDYTVNVDGELYDNIPFSIKLVSDTLRVYR